MFFSLLGGLPNGDASILTFVINLPLPIIHLASHVGKDKISFKYMHHSVYISLLMAMGNVAHSSDCSCFSWDQRLTEPVGPHGNLASELALVS